MKYFVYGAFVSCMIAYGISLVFGSIGTVDFDKISLFISNVSSLYDMPVLLFIGLLLILGGFFFKLGVVPFHG
jgi:NADH-quinone oxidoreductase subunit N